LGRKKCRVLIFAGLGEAARKLKGTYMKRITKWINFMKLKVKHN
jgi:hypothetical protein